MEAQTELVFKSPGQLDSLKRDSVSQNRVSQDWDAEPGSWKGVGSRDGDGRGPSRGTTRTSLCSCLGGHPILVSSKYPIENRSQIRKLGLSEEL